MPNPEHSLSLLDKESSTLSPRRPKPKLTPCRFCTGLALIFLAAILSIFFYALGTIAFDALGKARSPHLDHHHPRNETAMGVIGEEGLVRSFYGREQEGGVEKFDLIATIFHRVMVKNQTVVSVEEGALVLTEEKQSAQKEKDKDELVWGPWERIFSEVVLEGLDLRSKGVKTVAKVALPGKITSSLRNSTQKVDLVASFNTIPSSLNTPGHLIPIDSTYYVPFNSSTRTFPSPWPVLGNTLEEQALIEQTSASWKDQLVRFATTQPLLREIVLWVDDKTDDKKDEKKDEKVITIVFNEEAVTMGEHEDGDGDKVDRHKKPKSHAIVTRSMVTMVRDTSVYSLDSFKKQMKAAGESSQICHALRTGKRIDLKGGKFPNCRDLQGFDGHGHFQSLFEMGTEEDAELLKEQKKKEDGRVEEDRTKGEKGWRYGAFIQADAGFPGPADLIELSNATSEVTKDESGLTFDWHLTFSTSSALTVALAKTFLNDGNGPNNGLSSNRSAHDIAQGQDTAEFFNALIGHPFNPSSRPIVRKTLRTLSSILTFFSVLVQLHFWITRNVTTGISAPAHGIDGFVSYIFSLWHGILTYKELQPLGFWGGVVVTTSYQAIIWCLVLRLEFSWWGYVPVGVSRRKASHLERASTRVDMRFSWKQRGLASLLILAITFILPKLPYLIHASPPLSLTPEPGSLRSTIAKAWYFTYLTHLAETSSNLLFLCQFLLNQRSKTFGQNYRILAGVDLVSHTLHALPVLLSARWGRWELMDPLDAWDVLTVGKLAASAWQAGAYEGVKQEEEEEE